MSLHPKTGRRQCPLGAHRATARLTALVVTLGLSALTLTPTSASAGDPGTNAGRAQATTASPAPGSAPVAGTPVPVMVVLDASGSMNTKDAHGTRIAAAKKAVDALVDSLPANAKVGLLAYGTSTSSADAAKSTGCRDIKQLVALGPVDRTAFKAAVGQVKARGYTPIGNSLKAAAALLPTQGPRSIVLVSDGEDTCAPPSPCDTARQLKAAGTDLTVHTVGFKVDSAARAQLTCIAAATGGSYRETSQGAELGPILVSRVGEALRPYNAVGTRVHGSATPVGAPTLKAGQYVDSFAHSASYDGDDGHSKYYAVDLGAHETLYATVTLVTPPLAVAPTTTMSSSVRLQTPDGDTCNSNVETEYTTTGKLPALTNALTVAQGSKTLYSSCQDHVGQFVLRVARSGSGFADRTLTAEISVRVEPAADATGLPAPATDRSVDVSPTADTTPTTIDGGSSFDNAPLLANGTYRDSVVSGEARYYRVHIDFGQRLAYRIGLPAVRSTAASDLMRMEAHLASPVRASAAQVGSNGLAMYYGNSAVVVHGSSAYPARYTNRFSPLTEVRQFAVAGDYFLWIDSSFVKGIQYQLPLTLTVQVVGSAEAGPVYGRTGPTITPPSTTPLTPASSRQAPSHGFSGSSGGKKSGGTPMWVLLASIAGLLAIGVCALVLVRRRQIPITPPAEGPYQQW